MIVFILVNAGPKNTVGLAGILKLLKQHYTCHVMTRSTSIIDGALIACGKAIDVFLP
jgi:hypothetical protein